MTTFLWILTGGILMSAIALVGSVTLILSEATLKKVLLPLVALAAGTLLGGALFHMIPEAVDKLGNRLSIYLWTLIGLSAGPPEPGSGTCNPGARREHQGPSRRPPRMGRAPGR
jgi:hypothetical protein